MEEFFVPDNLVTDGVESSKENIEDVIKLYMPDRKYQRHKAVALIFRVFSFASMVVAFFLIYYFLYQLYVKNATAGEDIEVDAIPIETVASELSTVQTEELFPLVINETNFEIDLNPYLYTEECIKIPYLKGVRVIIVNSHPGEMVSESQSVCNMSEDLAKILESRGVGTYFDNSADISLGTIGAYSRMSKLVQGLKEKYNDAVIIVDIHDSDSGAPLTITVGCSEEYAWRENLRIACEVYKLMVRSDAAIRILPSSLGQNNGMLTLHIGIGNADCSDSSAREYLSLLAESIISLFEKEPLG